MKVRNSGNSQEEILIISSLLTLPVTLVYYPSLTIFECAYDYALDATVESTSVACYRVEMSSWLRSSLMSETLRETAYGVCGIAGVASSSLLDAK